MVSLPKNGNTSFSMGSSLSPIIMNHAMCRTRLHSLLLIPLAAFSLSIFHLNIQDFSISEVDILIPIYVFDLSSLCTDRINWLLWTSRSVHKAYLQPTPLTTALNVFALTPVSDVNVTHIWLDDEVMVGGGELPQTRSINSDAGPGPSCTCK